MIENVMLMLYTTKNLICIYEMFENNKLVKSYMISDAFGHSVTVHNERFAEDAKTGV